MKAFRILLFRVACVGVAVFAVFVLFSFTKNYSIVIPSSDQTQTARALPSNSSHGKIVYLDATKFFGSNLSVLAGSIIGKNILSQNPNGPQLTNEQSPIVLDQKQVTQDIAAQVYTQAVKDLTIYTEKDITRVLDTQSAVAAYTQGLKTISNAYLEPFRNKDISVLAALVIRQNDNDARKILLSYADASQQALDELIKLPVPDSWVTLHIELMNIISESRYAALAFLTIQNDPVRANIVAQNYQSLAKRFMAFTQVLNNKIKQDHIIF